MELRAWLSRERLGGTTGGGVRSAATMARKVSAVKSFYRWMLREGHITSAQRRASESKVPKKAPRFLDVRAAAVEQPHQTGWFQLRNRALLEAHLGAGLREAVSLDQPST